MARRRLSQQQKRRIQAAQQAHSDNRDHARGLVVSHQGKQLVVELENGHRVECKIKSNLGSIVCGDRVSIESVAEEHRVAAVIERDNLLQRVDGFGHARPVAANISQLVVCLAYSPEPNLFLLDQYLLSAEQQAIDACILINKYDLAGERQDPFGIERVYRPLGYRVLSTSVESGEGMLEFAAMLRGRVSVLGGVSGVGKSSLTAWLLPDEEIKVASISAANEEGRHTTRASRLYHLPGGGELIDTPGVRGFSPFVDDRLALDSGFREIRQLAADCRFHNCLHRDEPNCAVATAAAAGEVAPSRYLSYLKLLEQAKSG
jgi:ribosome biogenesis GTPase